MQACLWALKSLFKIFYPQPEHTLVQVVVQVVQTIFEAAE